MDFNPDEFLAQAAQAPVADQPPAQANDSFDPNAFNPDDFLKEAKAEQYGTPGQMAKTAIEGVAEGALGPIATGIEKHVLGVDPEEMLNRRESNPMTHGIAQGVGLGASLLTGVGEGALLAKAGQGAKALAGLGETAEGASLLSKIAAEGIDQAAQMALFQGGDEISKMLINDPNATAENAMANIGLSAALGGATGAGIGAISPLFKAASEPAAKLLTDFKARFNFRQQAGDVVETAAKEFEDLANVNSNIRQGLYSGEEGGLRGESIAKALPEVSEKASAKIDELTGSVGAKANKVLESLEGNKKIGSKAEFLRQDIADFEAKISNPDASYADHFNAIDDLKKTLQSYSKYSHTGAAESEFASVAKKLAGELKPVLEDEAVWGKAATVQKDLNKVVSEFIPAEKDIMSKFMTTGVNGEKVFDKAKIETYFKQIGNPKAEIKQDMLKNFLDKSEALHNKVNKILVNAGLEPQATPVSLNVLRDSLNEKTAGAKLADMIIEKAGPEVAGKAAGAGIGATVGGMLGHPGIGLLAGEHALSPILTKVISGLTKSISENPASATGFKSALDLAINAAKGQSVLNKAVGSVFKAGQTSVVNATVRLDEADRAKLDKIVTKVQKDPSKMTEINHGDINHYLPNHQAALSQATTSSVQYLASIKPHPYRPSPLDKEIQPSPAEMSRYNRALDIAQQPMVVLQHIKDGTLQATDVKDLKVMYPSVYNQMATKINNEIANMQGGEVHIPYKTRMNLSVFLGQPLDSTMIPSSIQAAQPMPTQPPPQNQKPSQSAAKAMEKGHNQYMTPLQGSEAHKASR